MKKYFLILIFSFLPILISTAQDIQASCQIIAYTRCDGQDSCKTLSLFEPQNGKYVEVASLEPEPGFKFNVSRNGSTYQQYSIAPNQQRVAIQEISVEDPLPLENFSEIFVYDIKDNFQYLDGFGDVLMAEGSVWSSDSNKLLYWDAWGHYILGERDFIGKEDGELWPALPIRSIRALHVDWSPSGDYIAVVGDEHPFPVSEHAVNDVQALYIAQPKIGSTQYTPISDPNRSVDWYYYTTEWLSDDKIAYTDGRLVVSTISGQVITSIEGNYHILGKVFKGKLLIGHAVDNENYELLAFDPLTTEFSPLIMLPTDASNPFPYVSFSPDGANLAYWNVDGDTVTIENMLDDSKQQFITPISGDTGQWTPDGTALLFFDYAKNVVHKFDLVSQILSQKTASEMFPDFDTLPQYPNWMCPAG